MVPPQSEVAHHTLAGGIVVGVSAGTPPVAVDEFDVLLTEVEDPPRPWVTGALADIERPVALRPGPAATLCQVLRTVEHLDVPAALTVESLAYSMLQHGDVFRTWLRDRAPHTERPATDDEVVALTRSGDRLDVVLQRPHLHNALSAAMRDALIEAFAVVDADPAITEVHLHGAGPSFCAGGDLGEFGTAPDPVAAHLLRLDRSVGRRVHEHASRVTAHLHGACIGAGIEISAFAGRVLARPDTTIQLPELSMGLIPGAGGTVSLPRRIGRHRTAHLVLTGRRIDAATARAWGLTDGPG